MDFSTILLILAYAVTTWYLITRFRSVKGLQNLSAEEFKDRVNQKSRVMLIDVREPHEYKKGYIPSAVNIPLSQLNSRVKEISSKNDVLLYCRSGMRSKQAAKVLSKHGFTNMAHLKGGLITWSGAIKKK
ncbi:rhodanese-like domain-containing protein [Brevibacillus choshinensis]|uniref:Rhodanese-like domain-containing protein n=1 Tax=Brevibacillus choshinensis TaxID=54911 RepID=A0ABX7FPL1_BRECH|nr:rhodanese-like domain-containing protein [Brevibacillus choshinensis]QRG67755.1 rhodanese-like domain-containing protein [Brevibacillus choshinensis]